LVLNNGEPYKLGNHDIFSLEFDFFMRDEIVKFGYIFRMISNKDENFDFIVNNESQFLFVVNNQDFQFSIIPFSEKWNHVTISFDKKQNNIKFHFNDETIDCKHDLKSLKLLNISFGSCDFKNFRTNDVAPLILKNVKVNQNNKAIHHWALDKHGINVVYDELKNKPSIACNAYWLMDKHVYWKKVTQLETEIFPQITFDSVTNHLYVLNNSEILKYSLITDSMAVFLNSGNKPVNKFYNRLLFNPLSGKLLYYGFKTNKISSYNFAKRTWTSWEDSEEETDHAHHNRYISAANSSLYLFGGYGHYKYNSDFFRINLETNERIATDLSYMITPRYLAAMGGNKDGSKIYILGGRGAEMGRQELSPKNFSDLFEIDLNLNKIKYLFDITEKGGDEGNVYSNNLVMTDNDSCFYVLAYPNNKYSSSITLKKVNLKSQEVKNLADSIEFYFRDVTAFCDLYYSPRLSQLVAVTAYSEDQKMPVVNVYTLDVPPLPVNDVIQTIYPSSNKTIILLIIAGITILLLLFIFKRKLLRKTKNNIPVDAPVDAMPDSKIEMENFFYNIKKKSILFLGGFQVFDKNGNDITGEFKPTLKHILVLIVLYTVKDKKGISSSKLQEFLWFDKPEESARNNRSVNMRKLRVLLQSLDDVDITSESGYWTISLPNDVLLDYKEALRLMDKIQEEKNVKKDDLLRLLELLGAGNLLPNIQLE
jgi:hypothetical protein